MKLRRWQQECFSDAQIKFSQGQKSYLCLATPGAGKTILAAQISKWLLSQGNIDFVIYISPSVSVKSTSQRVFSEILNNSFDGMFGSLGRSLTYQSLETIQDTFWQLFDRFNIFVILDEVHHLAGHKEQNANQWGKKVLTRVCRHASHVLTLSGTPWRTDNIPITAVTYNPATAQPVKNYCYGLASAVADGVCRMPWITSVDNNQILLKKYSGEIQRFGSFTTLLDEKEVSYQDIVENHSFLENILHLANQRLMKVKRKNRRAAGLIVASTVEHASQIMEILQSGLNHSATLVVHQKSDSAAQIAGFESGNTDWLVSVGMVSEGTDIPRLQVCCHLSCIRTELHFRQVTGRILRIKPNQADNHGYLFIPCQPMLIQFASRLVQDIPQGLGTIEEYIDQVPLEVGEMTKPTQPAECELLTTAEDAVLKEGNEITDAEPVPRETLPAPEQTLFDYFIQRIQISGTYVTKEQSLLP